MSVFKKKNVIPQNGIIAGPSGQIPTVSKAISLHPPSSALQMSNYHAQRQQTLFSLQLIAQFKRSDLTTVSPVISRLTCVCLGTLSLAFGFPYFSRGLACRNQRSIFLKVSEVCEDELF